MSLRNYYEIAKPRMVYGNLVPLISGYVLATGGVVRFWPFVATLVGSALGMASGCVFNNVIDQDIDAKMRRTKNRAVPAGHISSTAALVYATALGAAGFTILVVYVNPVAMAVGALGFFFYVFMYSMWWKRRSTLGTAMGSVAGAVPPVVGYVAATGKIDTAAVVIFAMMVAWQMPHFFAIAIRHADDYVAAGIPALPLVRGMRAAKVQMLLYVIAFIVLSTLLTAFGYADYAYLVIVLALGLVWLGLSLKGFAVPDKNKEANVAWAKEMFVWSLVVMVGLFVTIALTSVV